MAKTKFYPKGKYPYPEFIGKEGLGYDIQEGKGGADKKHKILNVPLEDDKLSRFIRAHELMHIKHSPKVSRLKIPFVFVNAAEDGRINKKLTKTNEQMYGCSYDPSVQNIMPNSIAEIAALYASLEGTKTLEEFAERAKNSTHYYAKEKGLKKDLLKSYYESTIYDAFCTIDRLYQKYNVSKQTFKNTTKPVAQFLADLSESEREFRSMKVPESKEKSHYQIGKGGTNALKLSGTMIIERPPLPNRRIEYLRHKNRSDSLGVNLKYIDRYMSDKQIFGHKRKIKGGVVAIDCSGSMRLEQSDIERILKNAPFATIALYCGDRSKGYLRIVAEKGKVSNKDQLKMEFGGNVIDFPVLLWLKNHEEENKVWICDGSVTGKNDRGHSTITQECMKVQEKAKIIRANNTEHAIDVFQKLRRGVKCPLNLM